MCIRDRCGWITSFLWREEEARLLRNPRSGGRSASGNRKGRIGTDRIRCLILRVSKMGRNGLGRFVLSRNLQKVEAGRLNRERQTCRIWGCSSAGRAPALQAGGRQFDSVHLHHQLRWRQDALKRVRTASWYLRSEEDRAATGRPGMAT